MNGWAATLVLVLSGCGSERAEEPAPAKVYVAVEEGAAIAVLDARDLHTLTTIELPGTMPHNVQVAPDGKLVWAALVAADEHEGGGHEGGAHDELIAIDPRTDRLAAHIDLGVGTHPAHVVVTPDSRTVLVTGAANNEVIRVDVASRTIAARIPLGHASGVHGARVSVDGRSLWAAQIEGKCAARVDLATGATEHVGLEGQAVQIAVSPDGRYVFASQYDTKKVARIELATDEVRYVALPAEAQGPVQLYPTPDGRTMLVADQGVLAGRPASNKLFFVDVATLTVRDAVDVGTGAHGVVASGDRAFVTAIGDDSVTAVDLNTHRVVARVTVGRKPNGISVWTASGGTP